MLVKFEIPGRFPSLNEYVNAERANRNYAASIKHKETKRAASAALGLPTFTKPVWIHFKWIEPNTRRDVDNVAFAKKFILDGLVAAGVLMNDSRAYVIGFEDDFSEIDKDNPRVEVSIWTNGD